MAAMPSVGAMGKVAVDWLAGHKIIFFRPIFFRASDFQVHTARSWYNKNNKKSLVEGD